MDGSANPTGLSFAIPVQVSGLPQICAIASGDAHSMARSCESAVFTWGHNANGQVGDDTQINRNAPVQVQGLPAIAHIAAGWQHSLALAADGSLFGWGRNYEGQLGDGTFLNRRVPTQIAGPGGAWNVGTPTFSVSAGTYGTPQTVVIATATAGADLHYTINGAVPTQADPTIASGTSIGITDSRTLRARAWKTGMSPSNIATAGYELKVNFPSLTAGGTFTAPVTVASSTTSPDAQLRYTLNGSDPTEASSLYVAPFTVSTTTTVKIAGFRAGWTSSTVRSATYNFNYGTLAAPVLSPSPGSYTSQAIVAISAMSGATIRYTTNGTTPTTSSTLYVAPLTLTATTTIKAKAFHADYTDSVVTTGAYTIVVADPVFDPPAGIYLPGQQVRITTATPGATINYTFNAVDPVSTDPVVPANGLLTVGNVVIRARASKLGAQSSEVITMAYGVSGAVTPARVAAGDSHSLSLRDDGVLWGWGANGSGQVGDGSTTSRTRPVILSGATGIRTIAAGGQHNLAIDQNGVLLAWGSNTSGQIGDGTTTSPRKSPVTIGGIPSVTAVAAGTSFSIALAVDGTLL